MIRPRSDAREEGAVAVFLAITLFLLFTIVALVIDIGMLRLDRREDQRISDIAAVAGAMTLGEGSAQDACEAALEYVLVNLPGNPVPSPANPCSTWPSGSSCPASSSVAHTTADEYAIQIVWPVGDGDVLMESRTHTTDGNACDRVGVSIQRGRDFAFAPVMGIDSSSTTANAVARSAAGRTSGEIASLVVLDKTGCEALRARGNGRVHVREVQDWVDPETGETQDLPGIITVDSDASAGCGTDTPAIESEGSNSAIRAGGTDGDTNMSDDLGVIFSYALQSGGGPAFDSRDVSESRLTPEPVAGIQVTRRVADDRWGAAIGALATRVGSTGAPVGFSAYPGPCTLSGPLSLSGDTWIGCNPLTIEPGGSLQIVDGNVVADGNVVVKGLLSINGSASATRWFAIRDGGLQKFSKATLALTETTLLLKNGRIQLEGDDAGSLTWTAPETAGSDFDLEDLAMWSESPALHRLAGQASLVLEGVWFAPNANPFEFAGGSRDATTVYQTKAQFITWRFDVSGNGLLVMSPDPTRQLEIPLTGISLIR